eukprot:TRINITY_DN24662_c0_g1_i3.p1 TRINITY_DN24662_c0_g1~~TRINITY_DN24662_c0_g1_i3.p1  ORF type:complete len:354 (+),score=85.81 TRINITY_DN24662_c0_g1_i3:68-1129(+)
MILTYILHFFFFLMIRRPPRSTLSSSSAASDVYKRQGDSTHNSNPLKRSAELETETEAPAKRTKAAETFGCTSSKHIEEKQERRRVCDQFAAANGGHCRGLLRKSETGEQPMAIWQCKVGHEFKALIDDVKNGEWCAECFNWQMLVEEGRELAITKCGQLVTRSIFETGVSRNCMVWLCHRNHRFEMSMDAVRHGDWCRQCVTEAEQQRLYQQQQQEYAKRAAAQGMRQEQLFAEARRRQAHTPQQRSAPARRVARKPKGSSAAAMPTSVPAGAAYSLQQLQLVHRVLVQPAHAIHTYKSIIGITPTDTRKDVQKKLRVLLAKLHPDKNSAPKAIDAFQRLNQVRDQLLGALR